MAKITNTTGPLWLPGIKVGEKLEGPHLVGSNETVDVSDAYAEVLVKHHAYVGRFERRELLLAGAAVKEPAKKPKGAADSKTENA